MQLYVAIDLHSNNSMVVVIDGEARTVLARRLPNELAKIVSALRGCPGGIQAVAVESTYNWYWLVDGLADNGFAVRMVNTAAVKQYDGLKYGGALSDAKHLVNLLKLGILPEGYICPKELRSLRDLMRKRCQLVRQRTAQILSIQNQVTRSLATTVSGNEIRRWTDEEIDALSLTDDHKYARKANLAVMHCIDERVAASFHSGAIAIECPGNKGGDRPEEYVSHNSGTPNIPLPHWHNEAVVGKKGIHRAAEPTRKRDGCSTGLRTHNFPLPVAGPCRRFAGSCSRPQVADCRERQL